MPYGSGLATNPIRELRQGPAADRITVAGVPFAADMSVRGLPLLKPPYGTISAVDMQTGEIVWEVANGETPESVRDHPDLQGLEIPRTGRDGFVAPVVTKTLLVVGEPSFGPTPSGRRGAMLRAYDKATGDEVGAVYMPAPQSGSPITYTVDGAQHIALAISGAGYPGAIISYRLPDPSRPSAAARLFPVSQERSDYEISVWDGVYTAAQAAEGALIYATQCAACHGGALQGLEMAPPLSGPSFAQNWNRQSLLAITDRIRAMPPESPVVMPADAAADVLSFMLQFAGFPAGDTSLAPERATLGEIEYAAVRPAQ